MAAAVTLTKKVAALLSADEQKSLIAFLTDLRSGKYDAPEVLLVVGEDVAKRIEATEPEEEKPTKAAPKKGESRLPAAPKKGAAKKDDETEEDDDKALTLREDRKYESSVAALSGVILSWTGNFVASGANEGHAKMRILHGPAKIAAKIGKVVPVPVETLTVTRKRVPDAKEKPAAPAKSEKTPKDAVALILPPFARPMHIVR